VLCGRAEGAQQRVQCLVRLHRLVVVAVQVQEQHPAAKPARPYSGMRGPDGDPLPATLSRIGHLWDALAHARDDLGFDRAAGGLRCSGQLALARIIEPVSKLGSLRVLEIGGQRAVVPDRAAVPARLCKAVMATAAGGDRHWLPARWKPVPYFG
jgi:hypothetical protein